MASGENGKDLVLWPATRWQDDHRIEREALGPELAAAFYAGFDAVPEADWRRCRAIVCSQDIPAPYRDRLDRLGILVAPRVGVDPFDLDDWTRRGVPVCNVPDYGTLEVADHAMAFMLALLRGIEFHTTALRTDLHDHWRPTLNPLGRRLSTLTLGIVGLGRIGSAVALRARAFGMRVQFFDPWLPRGAGLALGAERVDSMAALFAAADVVSLHTPLTAETRYMVDARMLAACRPGLLLINTARGELLDLDALYQALREDRVGGAGLDVLPEEPPDAGHPLLADFQAQAPWLQGRLLLTPHAAYVTPESTRDKRAKGAQVAARWLLDGVLENCVNGLS